MVCITGDGAFQMTAQEVSSIIRYAINPIIIIVNNGAYTVRGRSTHALENPVLFGGKGGARTAPTEERWCLQCLHRPCAKRASGTLSKTSPHEKMLPASLVCQVEIEIHDGPYNIIQNWDYTKLAESLNNGAGGLETFKVGCRVRDGKEVVGKGQLHR